MIAGLLGGLAFYCATAFPFAALTDPSDAWTGAFFFYGVVCGFVGTSIGASR
jgi:hypothetical protein